jgi:glutamate decarboxylase
LLIDLGIEKARRFADMIVAHPDFELITAPELNILTYRYHPAWLQQQMANLDSQRQHQVNELLDQLTREVQKRQREAGKTFVSRTRLRSAVYGTEQITVFRVVLANPLATDAILDAVLAEQVEIVAAPDLQLILSAIAEICQLSAQNG